MLLANMRMATKLGIGFALVSMLTLLLGAVALWQMRHMHASTQLVVQNAMPSVLYLSNLRSDWNQFRRAEAGVLNVQSVAEIDGYQTQIQRVLQEIQSAAGRHGHQHLCRRGGTRVRTAGRGAG